MHLSCTELLAASTETTPRSGSGQSRRLPPRPGPSVCWKSDYKPESFSGGQRQRVAVARALVNRPRMVLADEPTAALDKKSGRQVVSLLQMMAERDGTAVIIVTHDNRILDVADRIVNMVDGHVSFDVEVARSLEICTFLSEMPLFREFTPGTLSAIADAMNHERFDAGQDLIRQGDEGDNFYILRTGSVQVFVAANGSEREVAALTRGTSSARRHC